nr:glycosyltransferase family 2 protein [uncultured Acetatifactor sp.]
MVDISVIVTVYNLEAYVRSCLDSILEQTGVEFEVICVDDASTDASLHILEEYVQRDSRVKIVRNTHNMGLTSARNRGYRYAEGEYLYNIDGDDMLQQGALLRMHDCAKEHNLDLLGFSAKSFSEEDEFSEFYEEDEYVRKHNYTGVYNGGELFALLMKNGDRVTSNRVFYLYRREYFLSNHLYDEEGLRYADDSMFSYYITAQRAMCIPDQLYLRRYRQGSMVTSPMKKRYLESMVVLFCAEMGRWRKLDFSAEVNRQIEAYFDLRLKEINEFYVRFQQDDSKEAYLQEHPADDYFYKRFIRQEPLLANPISENCLDRIRQADRVVLYGAGAIATEVAKALEYHSVISYLVAVTKPEDNQQTFRGRQIKSIQAYAGTDKTLILVAMSERYREEIMEILDANGFQDVMWAPLR